MSPRLLLFLLLSGLLIFGAVYLLEPAPGYMDADYYALDGLRIAKGETGEPFLWHYLDDPAGIPHPAFSYWMPLPAWIAALGAALTPFEGDAAARLPFFLLSAAVPPLTAALGYALTRRRSAALLSGIFALLPAFYLPFLPTSDSFAPLALLGALLFLLIASLSPHLPTPSSPHPPTSSPPHLITSSPPPPPTSSPSHPVTQSPSRPVTPSSPHLITSSSHHLLILPLSLLTGLLYLTRAEGLLWLLPAAFVLWRLRLPRRGWMIFTGGFLLLALPWVLRNLAVFGTPGAPVGLRPLWLTTYDELYIYPASRLTPAHLLAAGWESILRARLWALGQNLQTALAVQGEIFLFPLIMAGAWRLRRSLTVQTGALAWGLLFLAMTFPFPFAGARGGFFHAGAALQPLWWALAPEGLRAFTDWGARRRGWQPVRAYRVFAGGLAGLAFALSAFILWSRVIGAGSLPPAWGRSAAHYRRVEARLQAQGALPGERVLVNNPPGYVLASGRPALAIPCGDSRALLEVARRYDARYLILEPNYRGGPLDSLYRSPPPFLRPLFTLDDTLIFAISP